MGRMLRRVAEREALRPASIRQQRRAWPGVETQLYHHRTLNSILPRPRRVHPQGMPHRAGQFLWVLHNVFEHAYPKTPTTPTYHGHYTQENTFTASPATESLPERTKRHGRKQIPCRKGCPNVAFALNLHTVRDDSEQAFHTQLQEYRIGRARLCAEAQLPLSRLFLRYHTHLKQYA